MLSHRDSSNDKEKSLLKRFLFILGIVFFLMYLVLGAMVIFWKSLPLPLSQNQRIALGILLIVYSVFRFIRLVQNSKE